MKAEIELTEHQIEGLREKNWAALSSMIAAVFLTVIKIVVGVLTGSLGILAEAAHSALDLAAAAMTFFAVKISGRPADSNHPYGHGKVENLSALFETLMLLATSVWIIYEAIDRLFVHPVHVEANVWSFVIMIISILINISRADKLSKVAKKYGSQALEADALHFLTDIWSSAVVIVGLLLIIVAQKLNLAWLENGDAVAAIIVAIIVAYASYELGRRAVGELLDEVPATLKDEIVKAASLPGVVKVLEARARRSGAKYFADLTLSVDRNTGTEKAHEIAVQVEHAVQRVLPDSSVLVHIDPVKMEDEALVESLKALGVQYQFGVHHIRVAEVKGKQILTLHLDVPEETSLEEAHARATQFEQAIVRGHGEFDRVVTHLEPVYRQVELTEQANYFRDDRIEQVIRDLPAVTGIDCEIHDVVLLKEKESIEVSFHCSLRGTLSIMKAHELTEKLELALRERVSGLDQVVIHTEPKEK